MIAEPISSEIMSRRIDQFLKETRPASPCVVIDTEIVRSRHEALKKALPKADIFYAVKANPAPEIISLLATLGTHFDVASPGEIEICLGLKVPAERLSFGNTIKRESAIAKSRTAGVELFAFDSISEVGPQRTWITRLLPNAH
jgi:ornithine decarboxylase